MHVLIPVFMHGFYGDSPESVEVTVKELAENLKEIVIATGGSSRTNLRYAKVLGIPCDVSNPEDVTKLANFAVKELGSIDIWVKTNSFFFFFFVFHVFSLLLSSFSAKVLVLRLIL